MEQTDEKNIPAAEFILPLPTKIIFYALALLLPLTFCRSFAAGLVASVFAGAIEVVLLLSGRSAFERLSVLLTGAAAYLVCLLTELSFGTGSALRYLVAALPALYPTAAAVPLWLSVRRKSSRIFAIAASAAASAAFFALFVGLIVRLEYGGISADSLKAALDRLIQPLGEAISSLTFDNGGSNLPFWGNADIDSFLNFVKMTFIGMSGAMLTVLSYLMTLILRYFADANGLNGLLPSSTVLVIYPGDRKDEVKIDELSLGWRIEPDSVSAAVMLIAYMVTIFLGGEGKSLPLSMTMYNIVLILTPCFLYTGVRNVIYCFTGGHTGSRAGHSGRIGKGLLIIVISLIMFFIIPTSPIVLMTWNGVISVLTENHMQSAAEFFQSDRDRKE